MIVKNIVFLFSIMLFAGCGVMNSSNKKDPIFPQGEAGSFDDELISRINTNSLIVTNTNESFTNDLGKASMLDIGSYKIFETITSQDQFLTDLNNTAQTLENLDLSTIQSWIKNVKDVNISYQDNNLLFYPVTQDKDCGLEDNITIDKDNNATITIKNAKTQCQNNSLYHALFYRIQKDIKNISVKAFSLGLQSVPNKEN